MGSAEGYRPLDEAIRQWLKDHPVTDDLEQDAFSLPEPWFGISETNESLRSLNHRIRELPPLPRTILRHLSMGLEPGIIMESIDYPSPEQFWLDKAIVDREFDLGKDREEIRNVFEINESLVNEVVRVSDEVDREKEKTRNRRFLRVSLLATPAILLLFILVVLPRISRPDPANLVDQYYSAFVPDRQSVDSVSFSGAAYLEALSMMDDGRFDQAALLFEQVVQEGAAYLTESRWFLALSRLRLGDAATCRDQLRLLGESSPEFYERVRARELLRKISR